MPPRSITDLSKPNRRARGPSQKTSTWTADRPRPVRFISRVVICVVLGYLVVAGADLAKNAIVGTPLEEIGHRVWDRLLDKDLPGLREAQQKTAPAAKAQPKPAAKPKPKPKTLAKEVAKAAPKAAVAAPKPSATGGDVETPTRAPARSRADAPAGNPELERAMTSSPAPKKPKAAPTATAPAAAAQRDLDALIQRVTGR